MKEWNSFKGCLLVLLCLLVILSAAKARADDPLDDVNVHFVQADGTTREFGADDFRKLPMHSVSVVDKSGATLKYTGVSLHEFLKAAGVPAGKDLARRNMTLVALVEARDEYRAVFALPELDPGFTDRVTLLCWLVDGKPLPDDQGPLMTIVPDEKRHARWVKWVEQIRIVDVAAK